VHGFAGPLGGMFSAPHGALCAALLPAVMETNLKALQTRQPNSPVLQRFDEIAQWLTGDSSLKAADGVRWLEALQADLRIPGLRNWGIEEGKFPEILPKASDASSMKGNPLPLEEDELNGGLKAALELGQTAEAR